MKYAVLLSLLAAPAWSDCPAVERTEAVARIVNEMRMAPDEGAAQELAAQMWTIWLDAPDEIAQALLDDGLALLQVGDYIASGVRLSMLIDYCPEYAEGYNQRAFAAFLSGNYEVALVDLDAAIALQLVHLGALTGKALTLMRLGRDAEAQVVLRQALAINPWLAERALLQAPPGEDI